MAENSCSSTSSDSDIDEDTFYDSDSDYSDKCTCYFTEPEYTEEEMRCMRKTTDKKLMMRNPGNESMVKPRGGNSRRTSGISDGIYITAGRMIFKNCKNVRRRIFVKSKQNKSLNILS